eukprot:3316173-Pyramimonas_sp.AAC.1
MPASFHLPPSLAADVSSRAKEGSSRAKRQSRHGRGAQSRRRGAAMLAVRVSRGLRAVKPSERG